MQHKRGLQWFPSLCFYCAVQNSTFIYTNQYCQNFRRAMLLYVRVIKTNFTRKHNNTKSSVAAVWRCQGDYLYLGRFWAGSSPKSRHIITDTRTRGEASRSFIATQKLFDPAYLRALDNIADAINLKICIISLTLKNDPFSL